MSDLSVLVVDDEPAIRQVLQAAIGKAGYPVETAGSAAEALARLEAGHHDVVLSDVFMPITDGIELLRQARARGHQATFIMVTAFASVDSAIDAIRAGAWDYITKPVRNEEILHRLEQIDALRGLREDNRALRKLVLGRGGEGAFTFESPSMQAVERLVTRVAPTDSTVLITGESGTGKGVAARRIHELSPRRDGPFVSLNCGAIPESLIESELFGHTKGAFTSADRARKGLFLQADRGTIFDEIGEPPLPMQTKLLHVLEAGREVRALGSEQPKRINTRIVAATNRDLAGDAAGIASARICSSASGLPGSRCRRCASGAPICRRSCATCWRSARQAAAALPRLTAPMSRRRSSSTPKPRSSSPATRGRATCGSWRTCCTAPPSWPTAARSASPTCRPRSRACRRRRWRQHRHRCWPAATAKAVAPPQPAPAARARCASACGASSWR
ncbi:MAG: sigma-54 dependent transcriptional regulator [Rubrivivax sp.]